MALPASRRPDPVVPIMAPLDRLPLRVQPARPLDDDALFDFCRANPDLRIERAAEGDLIIMAPTGSETGRRNFALTGQLAAWVVKDGTGVGFDSSTGFVLPNGAERSPDAAWVRRARWDALSAEQRGKFAPLCPEFVAEIRSPSDVLADLKAKMDEYARNGAALGWLIDPVERTVHVYRSGALAETLQDPSTVDGGAVLPGFVLDLSPIW